MKSEFNVNLGQLIKERRKELNLTQTAVCADFITRNMLSRIETGDASPSLVTLHYIAEKLKMPVEYFLSKNSESAALYKKNENISTIRTLFRNNQFKKCIEFCDNLMIDDCEIDLIVSESQLKIAEEYMSVYKLNSAIKYLDLCSATAKKCLYNSERIVATAEFHRKLIQCVKENQYPDINILTKQGTILVNSEYLTFIYSLSNINDIGFAQNALKTISNPIYKNYLEAICCISSNNYSEATVFLDMILKTKPDYFTLYFTVQCLELCYKEMNDFRNAYEYAKMRLELLEKFND